VGFIAVCKYENIKTCPWKLKLIGARHCRSRRRQITHESWGAVRHRRRRLLSTARSSRRSPRHRYPRCLYFVSQRLIYDVWPASPCVPYDVWSLLLATTARVNRLPYCVRVRVAGLRCQCHTHAPMSCLKVTHGIQADRFRPPPAQVLIISLGSDQHWCRDGFPGDAWTDILNQWRANMSIRCECSLAVMTATLLRLVDNLNYPNVSPLATERIDTLMNVIGKH